MFLSPETDIGDAIGILTAVIMIGCVVPGVVVLSVWGIKRLLGTRR
ncbi:MAG: hypothetical protein M3O21_01575 [Chloroflexota bacterium]|nr:hypothetical protein [Chloroflexota bacterium]